MPSWEVFPLPVSFIFIGGAFGVKHRHRIFPAVAALLLALTLCPGSALAAGEGTEESTEPAAAPAQAETPTLYPTEVLEYTAGDFDEPRISKTYELSPSDDPGLIPTEDFERSGRVYTLLDILKEDQTETDTKEHIEVITMETDTKDMAEILQLLEPELEITTEDGYTGVLTPDYPNIQVEASGYGTSSRTVSATRTYPNLSSADVALIPKSTEEDGRTLTLADVQWQEAATDYQDGYDLAIRYTATATYTGTATSKYATGYTVTADYKGDVTKTSCDTVRYTAIFASHGETQNGAETEQASGAGIDPRLALIPLGVIALGGAGFGGWKLVKYLRDKKRGYVK